MDSRLKSGAGMSKSLNYSEYLRQTLSLEEAFPDLKGVRKVWNVTELRSYNLGRCYTFRNEIPAGPIEYRELAVRSRN